MKRIHKVQVKLHWEVADLLQAVLHVGNRVVPGLDVLVDRNIITTVPNEGLRGFGSNHQAAGNGRVGGTVEVLHESLELLLGILVETRVDGSSTRLLALGDVALENKLQGWNADAFPVAGDKSFDAFLASEKFFDLGGSSECW